MLEGIKNGLRKIQESDEPVKKRWLIGMTAISMVIIIGLWLVYMNYSLDSFSRPKQEKAEYGFLDIFGSGLKTAGKSAKNKTGALIYKIMGERTIEIE